MQGKHPWCVSLLTVLAVLNLAESKKFPVYALFSACINNPLQCNSNQNSRKRADFQLKQKNDLKLKVTLIKKEIFYVRMMNLNVSMKFLHVQSARPSCLKTPIYSRISVTCIQNKNDWPAGKAILSPTNVINLINTFKTKGLKRT